MFTVKDSLWFKAYKMLVCCSKYSVGVLMADTYFISLKYSEKKKSAEFYNILNISLFQCLRRRDSNFNVLHENLFLFQLNKRDARDT